MIILYILNVIGYFVSLLIAPVYFSRRFHLGWWNLLTIPVLVALPLGALTSFSGPYYFLSGSLFNPYFQYALLVNNVSLTIQALTIIFLVNRLSKIPAVSQKIERLLTIGRQARPERMRASAWVFLALYVIAFLLLSQSFGLVNWIANPRTGYQFHRAGGGQWFAFALSFLSVSVVLAMVYARSTHTLLLIAPVYLFGVYLLGSKGFIISFAMFVVIILAIRRYVYLRPVAAVIGGGAGALVIYNFATSLGGFGIQEISEYSDYYVNAARYYQSYLTGQLPLFHGDILLSGLWGLVPRSLYSAKPYVYGTIKVIEFFYPGSAEQTATPAFATVDVFADFGWPQVVLYGIFSPSNLLNAFLYIAVLPNIQVLNLKNGIPHSRILTYCFLLLAAPSFLIFFDFPFNVLLFLVIVGVIEVAHRLRITDSAAEEAGVSAARASP